MSEHSVNPVQINLSEIEPGTELKREDRVSIDHDGKVTLKQDTREQLEADAISYVVDNVTTYEETRHRLIDKIKSWLNRQEAITEREQMDKWQHLAYGNELLEADKMALQDSIDELTTERDMLEARLAGKPECEICDRATMLAEIEGLTADKTKLQAEIEKLEHDCELLFDEKRNLTAERDKLKKRLEHQATYIAGVEDDLCRYTLQIVRNEKDFDKLTAECDDLRCTTEKLKKRNGELLDSRAYWINQVMSVYGRFYPHDGCVPADVCNIVIAKIDELETERDHLQATVDALKHDREEVAELTVIDDKLTAAEARAIVNSSEDSERAREYVEELSSCIRERALTGNRHLLFFIEHPELEDFIVAEFKALGYEVIKEKFWYRGCPAYTIRW